MPPPRLRSIIKTMLPPRLRSIVRNLRRLARRRLSVYRPIALRHEIQFWRKWFATSGLRWPQEFRERLNPDQLIQEYIASYIDRLDADCVHILDVGSGPVTSLGKKHAGKQLMVTATDLLAEKYDRMLEELGIDPPVRTIYADVEGLVEQFGLNAYDIVHARNCIDHTADPLRAMEQMLAVSKPDGFVVLYHHENEGKEQRYSGLHQWDFTCENGCFVIRDRRGRETNVTKRLAALGEFECTRVPDADGFNILTGIRKKW